MSNICVISGRISDYGPKLRYLESGKPAVSLTVLMSRHLPPSSVAVQHGHLHRWHRALRRLADDASSMDSGGQDRATCDL